MKKSLVSVILVASMMLSIGGCGLKKKNDSKILEGNWKADLECEKIVTDELSKDEDAKSNNMAMIDAIKKYADYEYMLDNLKYEIADEIKDIRLPKVLSQTDSI